MAVLQNNILAGAAGSGGADAFEIKRSLRFDSSANSNLHWDHNTNSSTTTWTFSCWVKRSAFGTGCIFSNKFNQGTSQRYFQFVFDSADRLECYIRNHANEQAYFTTNRRFRDPGAWLHLCWTVDSSLSDANAGTGGKDRFKLFVNGERMDSFASTNYPYHNQNIAAISSSERNYIGQRNDSQWFDGYLAEVHFVDGQALEPATNFGEYDSDTGVWNPIEYTGSHGTTGFYLDFSDNSSNAALGNDAAGSNNWTVNNLSAADGGPVTTSSAGGALPIHNTTDDFGATKGSGLRTDANASNIVLALPLDTIAASGQASDVHATIKGSGSNKVSYHNVATDSNDSYFYGSSCFFDGSQSDSITHATSTDFEFGTGDWTLEVWARPSSTSGDQYLVSWTTPNSANGGPNAAHAGINIYNGNWRIGGFNGQLYNGNVGLAANTWVHIAMAREGNALRIFINGSQVASKSCSGIDFDSTSGMTLGRYAGSTSFFFTGYMQELRVYKGVAKYTQAFSVPAAANPTVGAACDSLIDSPTNYTADTGNNGGNHCTFNPISGDLSGGGVTMSNGNLEVTRSGGGNRFFDTTMSFSSGKWYWEMTTGSSVSSYPRVGIWNRRGTENYSNYPGQAAAGYNRGWGAIGMAYGAGGDISSGLPSFGANDTLMFAMDLDNGKMWFGKNGTWYSTGSSTVTAAAIAANTATARFSDLLTESTGTSWTPIVHMNSGDKWIFNPGSRPFAYTPPTGFKSLCTQNFVDPLITDGSEHFATKLYTGNGGAQAIGQPVYSSQTTGGNYPDRMFDGSGSTWNNLTAGNTLTFTPSPAIACTQLELWCSTDTPIRVNVNGTGYGNTFTQGPLAYVDITPSGGMTSLTSLLIDAPSGGGGSGAGLNGLRINGTTIIVDGQGTSTKFKPDLVWIKCRSSSQHNVLTDSVRGTSSQLFSDINNTEGSQTDQVTAFNSDGFSLGANAGGTGGVNINTSSYAAWAWNAGDLATTSKYNHSEVWSNAITNSSGGWNSSYPITNAFNGIISGANTARSSNSAITTTFAPATGISYSTSVEVWTWYTGTVSLNGGTGVSVSDDQNWRTIHSGSGTLNTLAFVGNSGNNVYIAGIRVDGKILVDAGVIPQGANNLYEYNQSAVWSGMFSTAPSYGSAERTFNGEIGAQPGYMAGGGSWVPTGGITYYDKVEVIDDVDQKYAINGGTQTAITQNQWVTIASTTNQSGASLTSIDFTRISDANTTHGPQGIKIDGKLLVDSNINADTPSTPSTVRANQTAGFSIVTWNASSAGSIVAHGLNKKPDMIIAKSRTVSSQPWTVYFSDLGRGYVTLLDEDLASITSYSDYWGSEEPNSTVFRTYPGQAPWANNAGDMVAYCFTEVDGFSSFGVYDSAGGSFGPFVYTGFRPRWVMHKKSSAGGSNVGDWRIWDAARDVDNPSESLLFPNKDTGEATHSAHGLDILSNGFKIKTSDSNINGSGTYVYAAFSENPFKISRAR